MKSIVKNLENRISRQLRASGFRRLIVGVSGGADSIALLSLLHANKAGIIAAHCNFHLRGKESDRDADFVSDFCSTRNIPLERIDFDVPAYIERHSGISVEMACRELRYEWFAQLTEKHSADRTVTAHNADDNIETLFLNLLRGSGTRGLRGMLPDNGRVWRPLLETSRNEIELYLKEKGIDFVTDSTNLESDYRRNFLRNEVLPLLRSRWEGFDKAMGRTISFLRDENSVVEESIRHLFPAPGEPLHTETILKFPAPELLIRRWIEPLSPFSTTAGEVMSAIKADKPDVKRWKLRNGTLELRNRKLFLKKDV
ncbi:MAG: tRNA lysidine(34) synthetase TilS [Muribaculaceae bacterium]|nr:tRNA lysidine(34) synthetase TilS [Muribaculaceae bacterium]